MLKLRNQRDLIADLKKLAVITLDEDLDVMGDSYIVLGRYQEAAHAFEASLAIREADQVGEQLDRDQLSEARELVP